MACSLILWEKKPLPPPKNKEKSQFLNAVAILKKNISLLKWDIYHAILFELT